jgi:hypothetical protein
MVGQRMFDGMMLGDSMLEQAVEELGACEDA